MRTSKPPRMPESLYVSARELEFELDLNYHYELPARISGVISVVITIGIQAILHMHRICRIFTYVVPS